DSLNVQPQDHGGFNEGRLRSDLRAAAKAADPKRSLTWAAYLFAMAKKPFDKQVATAFADLAVTGRRSFAAFRKDPPGKAFCDTLAPGDRLVASPTRSCTPARGCFPSETVSREALWKGCGRALDRAYFVANFLRVGQRADTDKERTKYRDRAELGWIAV